MHGQVSDSAVRQWTEEGSSVVRQEPLFPTSIATREGIFCNQDSTLITHRRCAHPRQPHTQVQSPHIDKEHKERSTKNTAQRKIIAIFKTKPTITGRVKVLHREVHRFKMPHHREKKKYINLPPPPRTLN
jgi:hypothetical protein